MKYNERLVSRIVEMTESDMFTVSEVCEAVGIDRKTFYEWKNTKPEFRLELEDAELRRDEKLFKTARLTLMQKLEGYSLTEEKITYEPSRSNPAVQTEKSRVVKNKQYPPDLRAIKWVIEREDRKRAEQQQVIDRKFEILIADAACAEKVRAGLEEQGIKDASISISYADGTVYQAIAAQHTDVDVCASEKEKAPESVENVEKTEPAPVVKPRLRAESNPKDDPDDWEYCPWALPPGYLYRKKEKKE